MQRLTRTRRAVSVLATGIVAALAASLLSGTPASAASHSAELLLRGVNGSAYTRGDMSLVGKEGTTVTFTFQVRNTGTKLAQYRLDVVDSSAQAQLFDGALLLKELASSDDGYYTKPLAPGGSQLLTLKIPIPVASPAFTHTSTVYLTGTDGWHITQASFGAEEPALLAGATPADLFVKNGGQLAVGGPGRFSQKMTSPTIAGTQTATFSATLQNSTAVSAQIGFHLENYFTSCGHTVTVKDGSTNVTAAALAGTYRTPTLAKLGKRVLPITVQNVSAHCRMIQLHANSRLSDGTYHQSAGLQVNRAY